MEEKFIKGSGKKSSYFVVGLDTVVLALTV